MANGYSFFGAKKQRPFAEHLTTRLSVLNFWPGCRGTSKSWHGQITLRVKLEEAVKNLVLVPFTQLCLK